MVTASPYMLHLSMRSAYGRSTVVEGMK